MIPKPVSEIQFALCELYGKPVLFTELRIQKDSVPEGLYLYAIRHSDNDWGKPVTLEPHVIVNYFGAVLTKEPIDLIKASVKHPTDIFKRIKQNDFDFSDSQGCTIEDFLKAT